MKSTAFRCCFTLEQTCWQGKWHPMFSFVLLSSQFNYTTLGRLSKKRQDDGCREAQGTSMLTNVTEYFWQWGKDTTYLDSASKRCVFDRERERERESASVCVCVDEWVGVCWAMFCQHLESRLNDSVLVGNSPSPCHPLCFVRCRCVSLLCACLHYSDCGDMNLFTPE